MLVVLENSWLFRTSMIHRDIRTCLMRQSAQKTSMRCLETANVIRSKQFVVGRKTGTVYPDLYDENKQLFEKLLIVKINDRWELEQIFQLTWTQFVEVRAWDKRMNAWYVPYTARVIQISNNIVGL